MTDENPNDPAGGQGAAASDLQHRASHDLGDVTAKAKGDLDAITQRAAQDARDLGEQARGKVGEVTEQAKSFASDQKALAAEQINGVASAITKVADELAGSDQQVVARYARDLASGLSGVGKTINDNDVDDLMGMAQDFGRTQPLAFLGAAALAGFVASRFALASAHRRDSRPARTPTPSGGQGNPYNPGSATAYGSESNPYAAQPSDLDRAGGQ